jgi:hypothetical protein
VPRGSKGKREFVEEHIASRKEWGAYVDVTSKLHRATAKAAEEFLADIRARLARKLPRR